MSICLDSHYITSGALYTRRVFDNPEQCPVLNFESDLVILSDGFDYHGPGTLIVPASGFVFWYRFTDRGMLLGYLINPSGTSLNLPTTDGIYYFVSTWNFTTFQLKFYLQCMDHDLYSKNHLPFFYNYTISNTEATFSRIAKLDQLSTIQMKGFGALSTASFMLLPYTFFNTYKFDFEHTMYNTDGTLKDGSKYHPTMFADGGKLNPDFNFRG